MKTTNSNQIHVKGGLISALTALALVIAVITPALADDGNSGKNVIIPPQIPGADQVYSELLAKYWQWTMAFPSTADPASDTAPQESAQSGPVWFLAGLHGSAQTGAVSVVTRQITIPEGKALFIPILTVYDDNTGCPDYSSNTVAQLEEANASLWTAVTATTCSIDGVSIKGLANPQTTPYLVLSPAYSYTLADHDNILAADFDEPCIPDGTTVDPAVAEGVCLLLAPLSPGHHTIHFVGTVGPVATPFIEFNETYNITVADCKEDR